MIEVHNLTKKYGPHFAVSDLSFTIEKGQICGFLGPNGAGKSTTMNILSGCLAATEGDVFINGHDILKEPLAAKRCVGYLPELPPLYGDRTPKEYLTFVAEAKGLKKAEVKEQLAQVMQQTEIEGVSNRLIRNLSKGYKQRVGIAQALLGNPEVVILDEPTVGLDPQQIITIRDLIKRLGKNHTVILSSHILSEVQAVCQKILIIAKGQKIAYDTPENLEREFTRDTVVRVTTEASVEETGRILRDIPDIRKTRVVHSEAGRCVVEFETARDKSDAVCRNVFRGFADAGAGLLELSPMHVGLEEIFIRLINEENQDLMDNKVRQQGA